MKTRMNHLLQVVFVFGVFGFLVVFGTALPSLASSIDLSTWSAVHLDFPGGQPAGNWVLSEGNTKATQTVNCDPTLYLGPQNLTNYIMTGSWQVTTAVDDDFIGIVFGYQDQSHFYVMDWKQGNQSLTGYGSALEGFSIKKISAPSVNDLGLPDLWVSGGTTYSTILASDFNTSAGWVENTLYDFQLSFKTGTFTVIVSQDGSELWNVTVDDNSYPSGRVGLYNYSQDDVEYSGVEVVPIPSTLILLGAGLVGLAGVSRKYRR